MIKSKYVIYFITKYHLLQNITGQWWSKKYKNMKFKL